MTLFTAQNLITGALFLGAAQAETNSTSGNTTMVGWVSPAPRRSTWSIIWSCLSIFIVCSWKCVHLNIPTHEEIQGEWHTFQLCRGLTDVSFWPKAPLRRKWRRKILWMIFIALAPEFGVAVAAKEYLKARQELKTFKRDLSSDVAQRYTMAHAFYVQMGGVVIYELRHGSHPTRHESFRGRMARSLSEVQPEMFRMPESEIKDLSKADVITKAFAIMQCAWLIVQSISRVAHGYTISLLELATLAFIFCAFVMHILWWNKPFDVGSRRVISTMGPDLKVAANLTSLSMDSVVVSDNALLKERIGHQSGDRILTLVGEVTNIIDADPTLPYADYVPSILLYIASTAFLAIHLAAWNWEFPSLVVRSLWRWLNLGTLVISFIPLIGGFVSYWEDEGSTLRYLSDVLMILAAISMVFYVISRLVVLGLMFYCLSSMPESTYATLDWLAWVPHFS